MRRPIGRAPTEDLQLIGKLIPGNEPRFEPSAFGFVGRAALSAVSSMDGHSRLVLADYSNF
jgi:hypothetical protein